MTQLKQPIVSMAWDSAGGTLAILVAQHLSRSDSDLASQGQSLVLISPLLDCTVSHPEARRLKANDRWLASVGLRTAADVFRGDLELSDPGVSPLLGDITDLPPTLLLAGTDDL